MTTTAEQVSIADIADSHEFVVFDASAVIGKHASREVRRPYYDALVRTIATCQNLLTVPDVACELGAYSRRRSRPRSELLSEILQHCIATQAFMELAEELVSAAEEFGIINYAKNCPYADVRLAGLALFTAGYGSTAFASADKRLMRFVWQQCARGSVNVEIFRFIDESTRYELFQPTSQDRCDVAVQPWQAALRELDLAYKAGDPDVLSLVH
ncbi:hypothetical protein HY642_06105 [Candidatus Woesearchaeota archaeon]|nr:hypothetical protein [Candidatus Woesearchaeota archaeon]